MRIVDVREVTAPIASSIANAYIDFSKMTLSLVAVVTDVVRDGRAVVGYGFNSNGRYGQGGLIRERFAPRLLEADPKSLLNDAGDNLDPDRIWATLMKNEKPGGHGERSVAVGTIDMAVWDAVAKIARQAAVPPAGRAPRREADPRVFVYAAGGYYYPGKAVDALRAEMRSYLDRGYTVVKMKIGNGIAADRPRIEGVLKELDGKAQLAVDANGRLTWRQPSPTPRCCGTIRCSGTRKRATRWTLRCRRRSPNSIRGRWPPARTCSATRTPATSCATAACVRTATGCSSTAHSPMDCANISARWNAARGGLVARPLHSARRPSDVAEHRRGTGPGRQ